jgi:hypothetical protein
VVINILIALSYETSNPKDLYSNFYDSDLVGDTDEETTQKIFRYVGAFQMFLGVRFFLFYLLKKIFMSVYSTEFQTKLKSLEGFKKFKHRVTYLLFDSSIVYYSIYTAMSVLGIFLHPFFFAFHLYEVMNQFKTCRIFIKSIIVPYKQLILAFFFYNILIYQYAVLGYFFFWEYFVDSTPETSLHVGHYCDTLYMCYITVFDQTNKEPGGIGSYLDMFNESATFQNSSRPVYDITFKLLVPIIMLSIVKGVIVDTFGALRELEQQKVDDMEKRCYICGIERESFDKIRIKTFVEHIKESHNMWDYVHFLIYLNQKTKTEHNGEEYYVYSEYAKGKYNWVPSRMCLEFDDSDNKDVNEDISAKLQVIRNNIKKLSDGYEAVEASMAKFVRAKEMESRSR